MRLNRLRTAGSVGLFGLALAVSGSLMTFAPANAAPASVTVYDATPSPLPPNVPSLGFQATQTAEFGDHVNLGGTNRALSSVTVTMSTWAVYADYASDARYSGNSTSWTHPITVNIYADTLDAQGVPNNLLGTTTQNVTIPWRPAADPTCPDTGYGVGFAWRAGNGTCYNGLAFNATFDMSGLGATLPNSVIVGIAYNTANYGAAPIGQNGPYNSLNVGIPSNQPVTVGSDVNTDNVFWNTSTAGWYADGGAAGVGIFREDTNWTPNGTVALKITTSSTYAFQGFKSPIDNNLVNVATAGQTIPVKWRLLDGTTPVSDAASFVSLRSQQINCTDLSDIGFDAVENYTNASGLLYQGDGNWQFNWQTPKLYKGQCRIMTLTLSDGTTHTAEFKFR